MEVIFSELRQKEVINVADGKHLGKVCDITFSFPEGKVAGFTVTGCKGFKLGKQDLFIPVKCVIKIGEDAVLVNMSDSPVRPGPPKTACPPAQPFSNQSPDMSRRSFEEYE